MFLLCYRISSAACSHLVVGYPVLLSLQGAMVVVVVTVVTEVGGATEAAEDMVMTVVTMVAEETEVMVVAAITAMSGMMNPITSTPLKDQEIH